MAETDAVCRGDTVLVPYDIRKDSVPANPMAETQTE